MYLNTFHTVLWCYHVEASQLIPSADGATENWKEKENIKEYNPF